MVDLELSMRKVTKKLMVLGFIAGSPNGRRFGEIQRFVCELNGLNYDEVEYDRDWNHCPTPVNFDENVRTALADWVGPWKMFRRRRYRGFWCTNLAYRGRGILVEHCNKVNGRYFIKDKSA